ncbi:class I SAM-dependent methyltransferase [Aquidulcibacter paucihalophilus]|uniref:class I SAM-dependent methyltransferase n=1 Tax=Aquidulcibacter paucihalophilus TaxID=1978549 RepID=UPI000A192AD0|nr:methyltransferase [Aquidulcibacter paucihalophilus]
MKFDSYKSFIVDNTRKLQPPHCPEITLHLADKAVALWQLTADELDQQGLPLPFWAFAWAGGQALARYLLDNSAIVAGKSVYDLASGSGLVGIAAKLAGAGQVVAVDIDPFAIAAITLNAASNGVELATHQGNIIGQELQADVLLVGDLFYEREIAEPLFAWLQKCQERGVLVLIGDPGRTYLPKDKLQELACYQIEVSRELEDQDIKVTRVWGLA